MFLVDEVQSTNVVAPVASTYTNLSAGGKDEESLTVHEEKQGKTLFYSVNYVLELFQQLKLYHLC